MSPHEVKFHVYAETDEEVQDLRLALYDLVSNNYNNGVVVSASKLAAVIRQFGTGPLAKQFFR